MTTLQISIRLVCCCMFSTGCLHDVLADTIYQWTDPWGQVKYSKTQVPGSMVSELTELPEIQVVTEQQKQEAMLLKKQEMNSNNALLRKKKYSQKLLKQQQKRNENHCRKLRNMLADVRLRNDRKFYWNNYYFPGQPRYYGRYYPYGRYNNYRYDFLEQDLLWEIRQYCR